MEGRFWYVLRARPTMHARKITHSHRAADSNSFATAYEERRKLMPQVSNLFRVHRLNDDGMKHAELIAESFDGLVLYLSKLCPESREFSIVKTKLEEACFFAKKAMANHEPNQSDREL